MNDPAAFTSLIIAMIAFLAGVVVGRLYSRVVADEAELRICINPDCGWVGLEGDCIPSRRTSRIGDDRLCPRCYEDTEAGG